MRRSYPKRGEFWHHFKGNDYCILAVGHHSETNEEMVVYCRADSLDKTSSVDNPCIRPLSMFMSEVDHDKYPTTRQKYRFIRKSNFEPPRVHV